MEKQHTTPDAPDAIDQQSPAPLSNPTNDAIDSDFVPERLVRLVSVGLKEATMDSPSFRASMNHMHVTIMQCSLQLEKSINVLQKYALHWSNFIDATKDVESVFTEYLNDSQFISNDISKPCVRLFLKGQKIVSESALSLLDIKDLTFSNMRTIVDVDIPHYLDLRRNFERIQTKYDIISANYMQIPKHYDPTRTRDDALQLFEIRKQYIHLSMSLWIAIKQLEMKLSTASTDTTKFFWKSFDKRSTNYGAKLSDAIGLTDIVHDINQLNLCAELHHASSNVLIQDLIKARINSEDGAIKMYTPSSDIKDFDSSIITNSTMLNEADTSLNEKHGWVFIKSPKLVGKGDVWIKRWMFVKNGVFGFLAISPDGQYVQETDKIGVLLATFKHLPSEDRKFCFKISGSEINLTIQVETSLELKSWLTVFNNIVKFTYESFQEIGMKRYPPALNMLKLEPVVAKDLELVDVIKVDPQIEKTARLIEIQLSNLPSSLSINTPLRTSLTEKITLSHLYLTSTTTPSAITANFWGYVNWGLYFVLNDADKAELAQNHSPKLPVQSINLRYPKYYPEDLRVSDAEMRAVFEACVAEDELTLLKFNASWSPNANQQLFCTLYITTKALYVYSHTSGLISIAPIPLTSFLNSDVSENNNTTMMKVYFVSGLLMKLQLYTSDANLIKSKFNYILSNLRAANRDDLELQIIHLQNIDNSYEEMKQNKKLNLISNGVHSENSYRDLDKITGIEVDVPTRSNQLHVDDTNFAAEMNMISLQTLDIPAKALFHILFGDNSFLTQCTLPLSSSIFRDDHTTHTLWRCDQYQHLTRVVWNSVFKIPCALQKIEVMNNNKYYTVLQETPYLRFVFGINRKIYMRFVIYSVDSKTSKLMVYYSLGDNKNMLNWFSRKVLHQIMLFRSEALETRLGKAVDELKNNHRKISTAIKNYGPITKYESDEVTKEELAFGEFVNFIPLQLFSSFYYEKLNYEFDRFFVYIVMLVKKTVKNVFTAINRHLLILAVLGLSLLFNLFMVGRSSTSYWRERNINSRLDNFIGDKYLMERAVSMTDIDALLHPDSTNLSAFPNGSECFTQFLIDERLVDSSTYSRLDKTIDMKKLDNVNILSPNRELRLTEKLSGLRIERNEVLTKLNLLNYLERELVLKDWTNWVVSEVANCDKVRGLSNGEYYAQIKDYCDEVHVEMIHLYQDLL